VPQGCSLPFERVTRWLHCLRQQRPRNNYRRAGKMVLRKTPWDGGDDRSQVHATVVLQSRNATLLITTNVTGMLAANRWA